MTRKLFSLNEAAWHFAPKAWKLAASEISAKPPPKVQMKRFDTIPEEVASNFEDLLNLVGETVHGLRTSEDPTREMRIELIAGLCSGKYRAIGYETEPKISKSPKLIPISIFENKPQIIWPKDTVSGLGRQFEGVKIERPPTKAKSATLKIKKNTTRGRPTVVPDIIQAVQMADQKNKTFRSLARKSQFQVICEQLIAINANKYNAKLPSDRTIAKWIPKAFELLDRNKK